MSKEILYKDDYKLADKYACGNSEAGEILYAKVYDPLRKFVFSRTNKSKLSETQKEEIISDSFIRSIEKLKFYNGNVPFKSYVIGFASNLIKENFRKLKNDFLLYEDFPDFDENNIEDFYSKNPLTVLIDKERIDEVNSILNSLPSDYKDIITYRLIEEMPFKAIVMISGKSEDAIDSLFRRAIKSFREKYLEMYNNFDGFP